MISAAALRDDVSEHRLQGLVLEHLTIAGRRDIYWFAIPNAARRSMRLAARMKAEGMRSGIADLCIMLPRGQAAWLEMKKSKGGRQSVEQKGFQARCERMGHPYCLARTFDEAVEFLRVIGALR